MSGEGPVWSVDLSVHREALVDMERRSALRRLFVEAARDLGAFFACAEVERGWQWNGRSLSADDETESWPAPTAADGWLGLPVYPQWWTWYGSPYRELVIGDLPPTRCPPHRCRAVPRLDRRAVRRRHAA
jgi:hypothetical protein